VIAERLLSTTDSTISILDTLETRGLIRRLPHPGDRSKGLIDITPHVGASASLELRALMTRRTVAALQRLRAGSALTISPGEAPGHV